MIDRSCNYNILSDRGYIKVGNEADIIKKFNYKNQIIAQPNDKANTTKKLNLEYGIMAETLNGVYIRVGNKKNFQN